MVHGKHFIQLKKKTEFTWTLLNINIAPQPNYGIKLLYFGLKSPHSDMRFSNISITHSIF